MKREARILFIRECRRGYAFIVYRGNYFEEVSIYLGDNLRRGMLKLRSIGEIRYFYCINCSNPMSPGSLGMKSISFSSIEPGLLWKTRKALDILCCIVDSIGKTVPIKTLVYTCLSKPY